MNICMERGQTLISNKLKKLIKKKRNADVKTIIGEAAPSDLKDSRGSTLLHLAIIYHNYELAEYSIDVGCNVNAQDIFNNTPLTLALSATPPRNLTLIKRLLEADTDILLTNQANKCPLYMFVHDPPYEPHDFVLELFECLIVAMNRSNRVDDIADVLVQAKCKIYLVVRMRNAEWTKAVLQRLETIDSEDWKSGIEHAMYSIDLPNTQALLCYGPSADYYRSEYFFLCLEAFATVIKNRDLQVVEAYAKEIAEWTIWNTYVIEVLARLFETADGDALNIFLQHDIHLRVKIPFDVDLMAHCGGNSNAGVVELMRQNLIKTEEFPSPGLNKKSALHFAVQNGVFVNVRTFFKFGVDPNMKDAYGRTPLFSAFCLPSKVEREKRKKCVLSLLINQANPEILDKDGVSIMDFIDSEDDWCIGQIVLQHLAWRKLRGRITKTFDETSSSVINSNTKLKTYYDKCLEQLEDMKKHKFCGNVTIYTLIMQKTVVVARSVRNNTSIKMNEINLVLWDYYYRHILRTIIRTLKAINNCKSHIRCIILECLEVLRPYELIVDHVLDSFESKDFLNFMDILNLE